MLLEHNNLGARDANDAISTMLITSKLIHWTELGIFSFKRKYAISLHQNFQLKCKNLREFFLNVFNL